MVKFYDVDLLRALLKIVDEVVAEALLKHESIVAFTANQHIVARASLQPVSVSTAVYNVIAAESIDRVFALAACNEIVRAGRQRLASDSRCCIDRIGFRRP